MSKTKWLVISSDMSFKKLIEALRTDPFSEETGRGFDLRNYSTKKIEARFIERVVSHFSVEDPFGRSFSYDTTRFNVNHFLIYPSNKGEYTLVIMNPPRSLRTLINALSDVISGMSISEYEVDLSEFCRVFKDRFKSSRISQAKIVDVHLSSSAYAKVDVTSIEDALADFTNKFGKAGQVDKIKIERAFSCSFCNIEASRHASFCSDERTADELLEYLISYFKI